jgi:recombination protein RecA
MIEDNGSKEKALAAALTQIERQFGKGSMMRLGDTDREPIPAISTGSLGLDIALGIGGLRNLRHGCALWGIGCCSNRFSSRLDS